MLHPQGEITCASNVDWNREKRPSLQEKSDPAQPLKRKVDEETPLPNNTIRMADPGGAKKIYQSFETVPILPDPALLTTSTSTSSTQAPEHGGRENTLESTPDLQTSRQTSSTLSDAPPIHQIRRSATLHQNSSPKLISAYPTDANPHFPRCSPGTTTHFACLAQALQSEIEEPKRYEGARTCAEWKH